MVKLYAAKKLKWIFKGDTVKFNQDPFFDCVCAIFNLHCVKHFILGFIIIINLLKSLERQHFTRTIGLKNISDNYFEYVELWNAGGLVII